MPERLLVQLSQLARERMDAPSSPKAAASIAQCFSAQLVRRFVEDHGALFTLEVRPADARVPRLFYSRKESLWLAQRRRQAACGERADRSAASRGPMTEISCSAHSATRSCRGRRTGPACRRRSRAHRSAAEHPLEHDFTACAAVVFIIGDHRLAGKLTGGQQLLRNARVLGGDEVDRAEDFASRGERSPDCRSRGCDQVE